MNLAKYSNAPIDTNAFPVSERLERTHIASWHEPPALTLDERGMIRDCSKSGETLFGYRRHNLVWQHVSMLFPQLSEVALVQQQRLNPLLNFLCRCGKLFQTQNRQGDIFFSKLSFVHLEYDGMYTLRLIVLPSDNTKS